MALDHVRDYFTSNEVSPTDPLHTNLPLFFTRWVTHFCAPIFVLLAGAGVGLAQRSGRARPELARFLVSRGLWLVLLEITWVRFGWVFDLSYRFVTFQVIWVLGVSMICLAALLPLGPRGAGVIGLALVVGHDLFDGIDTEQASWLVRLLHVGGPVKLSPAHSIYVAYPLVPWVGVMALGYLLGWSWSQLSRRGLRELGGICIVAFAILRGENRYGDPTPHLHLSGLRAIYTFVNCEKYPPSLDYLLMTLGPALVALGLLRERALDGALSRTFVAFGRAPMLFYLLHIPLIHALSLPFRAAKGLRVVMGISHHGLDLPLPAVYAMWIVTLMILWWPTVRWARLKAERRSVWLSYL